MSIHIFLGKKWLLTSDKNHFILNEKNEGIFEIVGYYETIEKLTDNLIHREIFNSDAKSICLLADEIKTIGKICHAAFNSCDCKK
ncbi:DUF5405 family protein [Pectobacterium carotovorum]|uniref:DUF5405 family protein n=1 Tax=Pectobacterium TaxID=122277 RepID=UPI00057FEDB9|nr:MULTISPECIES: DUF5405 family protein [Pectobacterium]KHS99948.1 hypothetical protein RC88_01415 [Pectobacterium parvum]